ncbi:mucoidy inhibitor MuiA family protein [Neoroseomonas oryzicola]|uniref:Mucoidy inhibitor MuiA family protein n=1 Tax=Neoroseomonas oryzicola TaxID=535904 RepID=A0A9X9WES0_9PROT|nr:mucoidy inhibitor MuiA family protein [Neoroseomonas oryzicola]MBR0658830.1 mucoidy inhibitor MuiA family protein [Neoroseomonas oryzicola]NKE17308.1 mucoidy inhibitor MuiA family protein [Neoroseomonas oryzicola]
MLRRSIPVLLLIGVLAPHPVFGQGAPVRVEVAAPPAAVTVYPDQATVTRRGAVDLPAGDSVLVLPNIPTAVLRDSVTARGRSTGAVAIGSVELRQARFDRGAVDARRAALEARLREAEEAVTAFDPALAAQAAQLRLIERLAGGFVTAQRQPTAANEPPPRLSADPAAWRAAWEAVRAGTEEASEAMRRLQAERRVAEQRRDAIKAEIGALGGPPPGALEIAVAVRAEQPARLDLEVAYQLRGARWQPVYEVRLDTQSSRIALRQEAIVTQQTGEDWSDVALTLSTARPADASGPPRLQPWRIALIDPAEIARRAREQAMRDAAADRQQATRGAAPPASVAAPAPVVAREAEVVAANVQTAGFAVEYVIPGPTSVTADGADRRVRIADLSAEATMSALAIPRLAPRAFLRARFAHAAPAPTLPGTASLHLDGVFVGRTALPLLRPGEETTLAFGADDRIRVAYEPQARRRAQEGSLLTGRTSTEAFEAVMTLRSFHARPVEVTVEDQVPVSGDADLTVTLQADPAPTARDVEDRPGVLAWTFALAPGQERRIRLGYTVTAPRDRQVQGLPGR